MDNTAPVVVIGSDIRDNLLAGVDPIGKEIRVDGHLYRVIGVGTKRGKTLGQSADNWVMMPITTWFKAYGTHNTLNIWAKTEGVGAADGAGHRSGASHHALAAARPHRRQRQLRHRNQRQLHGDVGEHERNVLHRDDRDCVDFAARRRHRHHEHHAGVGDRAHARDRDPQGAWGRAGAMCCCSS